MGLANYEAGTHPRNKPLQGAIQPGHGAKRGHVSATQATPTTETPDAKKALIETPPPANKALAASSVLIETYIKLF